MKNCFLYSFIIFSMINFHPTFGTEQLCVATTCNRYTQAQVVRQLWNAVKDITPLGMKLANVLTSMSRNLTDLDHKLNTISGQTLWATNVYTGLQPDNLSISCVFEKILYLTILDDEFDTKEYNQAIIDYSTLIRAAVSFTVRSSLARFSCPTSYPFVTQPSPQECINGSTVKLFLEKYGSTLPPLLVPLVESLNRSPNVKDRTVAIILCVMSIEPLNGMLQCTSETPEFLKAVQLKACDVPILPCCCKSREEDILGRYSALNLIRMRLIERLMKK